MRARPLLWVTLLGILVVPRAAHAGLLDIIWEMSGPQMWGVGLQCDIELPDRSPKCMFLGKRLGRARDEDQQVWLIVDARAYFSRGKDAEDNGQRVEFRFGRARMVGFDPMIAVRLNPRSSTRVHSAIGLSFNRFFGPDFDSFSNYALKLRPLAVDWRVDRFTVGAAYNLRLYPDGFDARAPAGDSSFAKARRFEDVHGFLIEFSF